MARWFYLYLIFVVCLVNHVNSMTFDQRTISKRHIGSARENFYRAKQRLLNPNQNPLQQQQQQPILTPDILRARWNELFDNQNKANRSPLIQR